MKAVRDAEVVVSWDPAQTGDWCGISVMRLDGVDTGGNAIGRILGCARQKRVTYDRQAEQIVKMVEKLHDSGARGVNVVIDAGGVGRGLMDMVRAASPLTANTIGISIHGGSKSFVDRQFNIVRAAKLSVVSFLDSGFSAGRMVYAPNAPGIGILEQEIKNLRATTTAAGNVLIEAASNRHDDVFFSVAQGWYAVASPETGPPIWSQSNVAYFEQLAAARAPVEEDYFSQVSALKEPKDTLIPVRKTPYRFRLR